eukprot:6502828-Alexandrium_andersonii.AAC.1
MLPSGGTPTAVQSWTTAEYWCRVLPIPFLSRCLRLRPLRSPTPGLRWTRGQALRPKWLRI